MFTIGASRMASNAMLRQSRFVVSRRMTATSTKEAVVKKEAKKGWWHNVELWGGLGAAAAWGMSGSAIYDAAQQGPEVISLTMTPVLLVYSSLFIQWCRVVLPPNYPLMACHMANVVAQSNQLRRGLEHKMASGEEEEAHDMMQKMGMGLAGAAAAIIAGPTMQSMLTAANLGVVSTVAAADAGPFTIHFWAPMSKWCISGASFFEFDRPTDKISLPQYTALTATGLFFTRYALLVTPINYTLCSVNIALFSSSAWHLGRKLKADFYDPKPPSAPAAE